MKLLEAVLKYDYSLSHWFSSSNEKIVPGTAFLFLNKISFVFTALYFTILPLLPFKFSIGIAITLLCVLTLTIMYGLQKKVEKIVIKLNFSYEYSKLKNNIIYQRRLYGALLFVTIFSLMIILGILSFEGYALS